MTTPMKEEEQQVEENNTHINLSSDDNEKQEQTPLEENNDKQIVLYNPSSSTPNDDNSGKEIVLVSDPASDPDPLQCRPMSVAPRVLPTVGSFTVQCADCLKWRFIPSKEKYEEIREHIMDQPFTCELAREWRAGISCLDPADLEQDGSRLWAIDKPSIAQPPHGWERELRIRGEGSSKFADVYYIAPTGKRLRSMVEIHKYLMEHPEFIRQGVTLSQFSFQTPKPLQENYVRKRSPAAPRINTVQAEPIAWAAPPSGVPTLLQLGGPGLSDSYSIDSATDVTPPPKTKSRSPPTHTFNDSFQNQPKRFKIKGPSAPPNGVYDL